MTPRASARSPIDFVPVDGTVKVPQDLISGLKFNLIDFGGLLRSSQGCGSQLTKPSELAFRANFKTVNVSVSVSQSLKSWCVLLFRDGFVWVLKFSKQ